MPLLRLFGRPQPAPQPASDFLQPQATPAEAPPQQIAMPLPSSAAAVPASRAMPMPAAPRPGRRRATDDLAAQLEAAERLAYAGDWSAAQRVLEGLHSARPHAPEPLVRLVVACGRTGGPRQVEAAVRALQARVPAAVDRALAWLALYANRPQTPAHKCLSLSLEQLLAHAELSSLSPAEQGIIFNAAGPGGSTLLLRVVRCQDAAALAQALPRIEPLAPRLTAMLSEALMACTLHLRGDMACALLACGARPPSEEAARALSRHAFAMPSANLLQALLEARVLLPNAALPVHGHPASLLQLALQRKDSGMTLCLIDAGADLFTYPTDTVLPSPLMLALEGPRDLLEVLVATCLSPGAADPITGETPLTLAARANLPQAVNNLLFVGAPWDDAAARAAAVALNAGGKPSCLAALHTGQRASETAARLARHLGYAETPLAFAQAFFQVPPPAIAHVCTAFEQAVKSLAQPPAPGHAAKLLRALCTAAIQEDSAAFADLPQLAHGIRTAPVLAYAFRAWRRDVPPEARGVFALDRPKLERDRDEAEHLEALEAACELHRTGLRAESVQQVLRHTRALPAADLTGATLASFLQLFVRALRTLEKEDIVRFTRWTGQNLAFSGDAKACIALAEESLHRARSDLQVDLDAPRWRPKPRVRRAPPPREQQAPKLRSLPKALIDSEAHTRDWPHQVRLYLHGPAAEETLRSPLVDWPGERVPAGLVRLVSAGLTDEETLERLCEPAVAKLYGALLQRVLGDALLRNILGVTPAKVTLLNRLLLKFHPDKGPNLAASGMAQLLNALRTVLREPAHAQHLARGLP